MSLESDLKSAGVAVLAVNLRLAIPLTLIVQAKAAETACFACGCESESLDKCPTCANVRHTQRSIAVYVLHAASEALGEERWR